MPRIAIISDSHGSVENAYLFREKIGQVDALYHLGDHAEDAAVLSQILNCGYVCVRGNCDPFSSASLTETVEWDGTRVLLLHGHTVSGRLNLRLFAQQERADIVLFGHSHVPSVETVDGILMINPGSLSRPRTLKGPSMAVLTLSGTDRSAELFFL
jgi:putative phosphoesterase